MPLLTAVVTVVSTKCVNIVKKTLNMGGETKLTGAVGIARCKQRRYMIQVVDWEQMSRTE